MAKKSDNDPRKGVLARIKRTEAYAERVRTLFAATVNEILALNKTMPELDEGEMFSFDASSVKKQREVERLLRQLHSVATMVIQSGIKLEWAAANAECDKLVQSCFGKRALNTPEFTAWTQRNEAAMAAFIARSEKGLNLSQRVWKSCRQLRDEMEVAITVAVGDGTSAASMSRSVRKYLNDPDLMFRRFRYKDPETGEWKRKWKKRVIGEDGKVHFIDYDKDSYQDDWTGPGYYKSSAQNAMRVARTETNIAYRRADNARWQQMDFVLGQRVQLSRNHPKKDICDKLAGDYPPDFVFDGWHPQCFCFVTPILMDEDEILKMNEAMLEGKEYKPRGKRITQYPDNFKEWVRENEEKILASHDFGSDPYFVRNNFSAVQDILNPKKQLTPLEIAEQRHANRTPEQEEAIRLKWQERQERIAEEKRKAEAERLRIERINKTAQNVLKTATTRFADFGLDTVALEAAMQSGDTAIINAETRALAQAMAKKQQQIKQTANNVISVVNSRFAGHGIDMSELEATLKTGNLSAINAQTRALARQISNIQQADRAKANAVTIETPIEKITVAEMQYIPDSKKMSNVERVNAACQNIELYFGKKSSEASYAQLYQGRTSISDAQCKSFLKNLNDTIGKYNTPELPVINHLMELRNTAKLSQIYEPWRARYNEIVRKLNAHDFTTGYQSVVRDIEEAYNIYRLSVSKTALNFGISKISSRTPYALFDEFEKKIPGFIDYIPDKDFFDAFPEFVPLFTKKPTGVSSGAYHLPSRGHVVIGLNDADVIQRLNNAPWYRKGLVYHEYGHALDKLTGQKADMELLLIFDNFCRTIRTDANVLSTMKKSVVDALKPNQDAFNDWWPTSQRYLEFEKRISEARTYAEKKKLFDERSKARNEEYSKQMCEIEEQIGAFTDVLQSVTASHDFISPRGHGGSYFFKRDAQLAEFIAHCSENYWNGNAYFEKIAPDLYRQMRKYIESKLPDAIRKRRSK